MTRGLPATFAWLVAFGTTASASASENMTRTVSVSGTAVTRTVPDIVVWQLTIMELDKSLITAKESSDEQLKTILGLKDELGIQLEDMQTGRLSIRKEYERDRYGNRKEFKHFVVTRSVTIRQRDLKRFDEYLDGLTKGKEPGKVRIILE